MHMQHGAKCLHAVVVFLEMIRFASEELGTNSFPDQPVYLQ